jgi:mono/diheme cytochrome c family protein
MREQQSWLPMGKMMGKVPREPVLHRAARDQVRPADHQSGAKREIIVSRVRRFSPWVLGLLAAMPLVPAAGQNLDAGKPASQIFAEVCANCHRSPREFKSNPGPSFLREHYTTGSEMAATMSAYLSAGIDPRGAAAAAQSKRQPASAPPTGSPATTTTTTTTTREAPAADPSAREPRRAQQAAEPKTLPVPPGVTRSRPASARADAAKPDTAPETKPPAPTRPVLEEFEE